MNKYFWRLESSSIQNKFGSILQTWLWTGKKIYVTYVDPANHAKNVTYNNISGGTQKFYY